MDIVGLLKSAFNAVVGWFGWSTQKDTQLNSPAMVANRQAELDQKEHEANIEAIEKDDINEERKHIAE